MANILDKLVRFKAREFDKLRKTFLPKNSSCFLIKRGTGEKKFQTIGEVTGGWYLEFDRFRNTSILKIAEISEEFERDLKKASLVSINGSIYEISDGDTVEPIGEQPFWRLAIRRTGDKYDS